MAAEQEKLVLHLVPHAKMITPQFIQYAQIKGIPELRFQDFEVLSHVADGGYGAVFKARRKADGKCVAMKFFGYVKGKFEQRYIEKEEIAKDWDLNRLNCSADLLGYFFDSYDGYVSHLWRNVNDSRIRGKYKLGRFMVLSDVLAPNILLSCIICFFIPFCLFESASFSLTTFFFPLFFVCSRCHDHLLTR